MGEILLVGLFIAPVAVIFAVARNERKKRLMQSATVDLDCDEKGIRRKLADGREEGLDWDELNEVEVYRAKKGPHGKAGGVIVLGADDTTGCLVPIDRLEDTGLAVRLSQLPGFRMETLVEAIEARPPNRMSVWEREKPDDGDAAELLGPPGEASKPTDG